MTEAMLAHAFGLQSGTVCPVTGKRFLQYAELWTAEKAREMLALGITEWCAPVCGQRFEIPIDWAI